jgi:hypothetical protein
MTSEGRIDQSVQTQKRGGGEDVKGTKKGGLLGYLSTDIITTVVVHVSEDVACECV